MIHYSSVSSFNARNIGLLAAIRANDGPVHQPESLATEEERQAWRDGVSEGSEIRNGFSLVGFRRSARLMSPRF